MSAVYSWVKIHYLDARTWDELDVIRDLRRREQITLLLHQDGTDTFSKVKSSAEQEAVRRAHPEFFASDRLDAENEGRKGKGYAKGKIAQRVSSNANMQEWNRNIPPQARRRDNWGQSDWNSSAWNSSWQEGSSYPSRYDNSSRQERGSSSRWSPSTGSQNTSVPLKQEQRWTESRRSTPYADHGTTAGSWICYYCRTDNYDRYARCRHCFAVKFELRSQGASSSSGR